MKLIQSISNATLFIKDKYNNGYYLTDPNRIELKNVFHAKYLRDAYIIDGDNAILNIVEIGKKIQLLNNEDGLFDFSTMRIIELPINTYEFPSYLINKNIKE